MGASWQLPAWLEDNELTIHTKEAFFLWLICRAVGFNATSTAKRIVYFSSDPSPQHKTSYHAIKTPQLPKQQTQRPAHRTQIFKESNYKFHSLAISDGSSSKISSTDQHEVAVNFARAVVPRRQGATSTSEYGEMCYTHVIPRDTPPHRLPLTAQEMCDPLLPPTSATQADQRAPRIRGGRVGRAEAAMQVGCPGVASPYETVTSPHTVSVPTADGRHRPMVETQIYTVYPMSNEAPPLRAAAGGGVKPTSASTQTNVGRHRSKQEAQIITVCPMSNEATPYRAAAGVEDMASGSTQTGARRKQVTTDHTLPAIDNECSSHYWNAPSEQYPELPDFDSDTSVELDRTRRHPNANMAYFTSAVQTDNAFRSAANREELRAGQGSFLQFQGFPRFRLPMIYFYHY